MKKTKLFWPLAFLPILLLTELNYFSNGIIFNKDFRTVDYPYMNTSDPDSFKIIPNSETQDGLSLQMKIIDNGNKDFAEDLLMYAQEDYSEDHMILTAEPKQDFSQDTSALVIDYGQSDIANNEYRFHVSGYEDYKNGPLMGEQELIDFYGFDIAMDDPNSPTADFVEVNNDGDFSFNYGIAVPYENNHFYLEPTIKPIYADMGNYSTDSEIFKIESVNKTEMSVTFSIKVNNWKNPLDILEVSLTDLNEQDYLLDTKPYYAQSVIDTSDIDDVYTYKITNLQLTSYEFSSLNNTKFTLSQDNDKYTPDNNILFKDELLIPQENLSFSLIENNAYVSQDGLDINQETMTMTSIQFTLTVTDNITNDFYNSLITNNKKMEITLFDQTNGNEQIDTFATWLGTSQPTDGIYTFEIDNLTPGISYELYSLNNTGLAIDDSSLSGDNEILVNEELSVENNIFSTTEYAYVETGSFNIIETTRSTATFSIDVNNVDNSYIPQDITVRLNDASGPLKNAKYIENEGSTYTYQIVDLNAGESYSVYSLNNLGLAVGPNNSTPDNEILVNEELGATNNTFNTLETPYIVSSSFQIVDVTKSSVSFSIEVINNDNSFNSSKAINTTLKNSGNKENKEAIPIVDESTTDDIFTYRISNLELDTSYQIYSLNGTELATTPNKEHADRKIIVEDELGISSDENSFTTLTNPYIVDESFNITEVTKNSIQFELTIVNDDLNSFIPENDLNVTVLDEQNNPHQTTAHYLKTDPISSNQYTYEITELEPGVDLTIGTTYTVYSLNDTGLATSQGSNQIDDEILISTDLHSDGNVSTIGNAYVEYQSFEVVETTKTTMNFNLTIHNEDNSFNPNENIYLKMDDENGAIYEANFVEQNGDVYTYQITDLEIYTTYEIYSISGLNLAINDDSNEPQDEIILESDLGEFNSEFTTVGNAYVDYNGVNINDQDITKDSMKFSLTVNNEDNSFIPTNSLDVTLNGKFGPSYEANWVKSNGNVHTYQINGLMPGTEYSLYSIDNANLAVGSGGNEVDNHILLEDELKIQYDDTSFATIGNPYIEENGFILNSGTETSKTMNFTVLVHNFDIENEIYKNDLQVKLLNEDKGGKTELHNAKFIKKEGDYYTYEINNLHRGTNYTIYSFTNPPFAISPTGEIGQDVLLSDIGMTDTDYLTFSTLNFLDTIFVAIITIIIVLLLFSFAFLYYLYRKRNSSAKILITTESNDVNLIDNVNKQIFANENDFFMELNILDDEVKLIDEFNSEKENE